jgi:hypothetical protein
MPSGRAGLGLGGRDDGTVVRALVRARRAGSWSRAATVHGDPECRVAARGGSGRSRCRPEAATDQRRPNAGHGRTAAAPGRRPGRVSDRPKRIAKRPCLTIGTATAAGRRFPATIQGVRHRGRVDPRGEGRLDPDRPFGHGATHRTPVAPSPCHSCLDAYRPGNRSQKGRRPAGRCRPPALSGSTAASGPTMDGESNPGATVRRRTPTGPRHRRAAGWVGQEPTRPRRESG